MQQGHEARGRIARFCDVHSLPGWLVSACSSGCGNQPVVDAMKVRAGVTSLTVAVISSAEKAAMLRDEIAWVGSLGRDLTNTQFSRYLSEIERYAQDLAAGKPPENSALFYAGTADGYVLSLAYRQLRGRYDPYVARRIDRACRVPTLSPRRMGRIARAGISASS